MASAARVLAKRHQTNKKSIEPIAEAEQTESSRGAENHTKKGRERERERRGALNSYASDQN